MCIRDRVSTQSTGPMSDAERFKAVTALTYENQAKFFLNAFWVENGSEAENVWTWVQKFVSLDHQKGKEGCDLDEFSAHRFLESVGETKRVVELRDDLRAIDLDFNKRMALIEFLLFKFKQTIKVLLSRPQGTNESLALAQKALQDVQKEIETIETKKNALQKASEAPGVKGMQAKNELDQLLAADQTGLNKAVLSAEAAVRKAQKMGDVSAQGSLWWINRELEEAKKYKPKRNLPK
eukprot:TRINITY_DN2346_c0_g1_i1.p1 TRINITY_DN2346_c0_g1~~TRINITY_DN2346_c0_g1_i1.p1  ORF type:complete len:237 (-),score=82.84 TRINITY_DN2346_c0_g1_i1:131-841(-)